MILKKRLKGLLALTLSAAMLSGNMMTASAETAPDYSYECVFFSTLEENGNSFNNVIKDSGCIYLNGKEYYTPERNKTFGPTDQEIEVFNGGQPFTYMVKMSGMGVTEDADKKLSFYINGEKKGEISIKPYIDENTNVITGRIASLGEPNKKYIWESSNGSWENGVQISSLENGSIFEHSINLREVYNANVSPSKDAGYVEGKQIKMIGTHVDEIKVFEYMPGYSMNSAEKNYAAEGEKISSDGGGNASHVEIRQYKDAAHSDYTVIPMETFKKDFGFVIVGSGCTFTMPAADISVFATTDKEALADANFVKKYEVKEKAATCTESGNVSYVKCPVCEKYFVKEGEVWTEKTLAEITKNTANHVGEEKVAAKGATCTTSGNMEYWYCKDCKKYYSDEACTREITLASTVIAATNHSNKEKVVAKGATCTTAGNSEYYYCKDCNKYFSDEACSKEISADGKSLAPINHKNLVKTEAVAATCTTEGNIEYYTCADCHLIFADSEAKTEIKAEDTVVAKSGHDYENILEKATPKKAGSSYEKCKNCGEIANKVAIAKPVLSLSKDILTYNGKVQKPTVTVKGTDGKKLSAKFYKVTYKTKDSKKIGSYDVEVKLSGNYSGTLKGSYMIGPKGNSLKKVSTKKAMMHLEWIKGAEGIQGYELQYSTDKNFAKDNKTVVIKSADTLTKDIKKLKTKKTYYVRVRTYTTIKKAKIYSVWSKSKKITIK